MTVSELLNKLEELKCNEYGNFKIFLYNSELEKYINISHISVDDGKYTKQYCHHVTLHG